MKDVFYTLAILFVNIAISQTHHISKHNGEELDVNFIKYENDLIYYSLDGSAQEHKITKYAVSKITNKNTNQTENISDRVVVNSKSDYKLVIVLPQEKTIGLKEAANFTGLWTNRKGEPRMVNNNYTILRIKTKSASNGYPFVSIVEKVNGMYEAIAYVY